MTKQYSLEVSKYLSYVLRHAPESVGLKLDAGGAVSITELIARASISLTRKQIEDVVAHNEKKRFTIDGDRIWANQGHSIEAEVAVTEVVPPQFLFHGTSSRKGDVIREEGLKKMNRNYVHLSDRELTAHSVGMRHGPPLVLVIDAKTMHDEGHKFWLSSNGVYLTLEVPPQFIQ